MPANSKKSASKSTKKAPVKKSVSANAAPKQSSVKAVTENSQTTRRDFIVLAAGATAGVGAAVAAWPFVTSMNPAQDVLALSSVEYDISSIKPGQSVTVMWRGKPVAIRHRTQEEISKARADDGSEMCDPQKDTDRTKPGKDEWLILIAVCTHLGCVPIGNAGEYSGWFCPCHGSQYDTSGRIRKGPAPKNLEVPPYQFVSDSIIKIG